MTSNHFLSHFTKVCAFWMLASQSLSGQPIAESKCSVTLRVINLEGVTEPYAVESFTGSQDQDYANTFRGLTGIVPCDTYNVVLRHATYQGSNKEFLNIQKVNLQLRYPETWITLHGKANLVIDWTKNKLAAVDFFAPDVSLGKIEPAPGSADMWVHFQESFGDKSYQAKVDPDGMFRIYKLGLGRYLIHIVKDGKVVYLESVALEGAERLYFKLPEQPFTDRRFTLGTDKKAVSK